MWKHSQKPEVKREKPFYNLLFILIFFRVRLRGPQPLKHLLRMNQIRFRKMKGSRKPQIKEQGTNQWSWLQCVQQRREQVIRDKLELVSLLGLPVGFFLVSLPSSLLHVLPCFRPSFHSFIWFRAFLLGTLQAEVFLPTVFFPFVFHCDT